MYDNTVSTKDVQKTYKRQKPSTSKEPIRFHVDFVLVYSLIYNRLQRFLLKTQNYLCEYTVLKKLNRFNLSKSKSFEMYNFC